MARADKKPDQETPSQKSPAATDGEPVVGVPGERDRPEEDGYQRTRRQVIREGSQPGGRADGKASEKKGPPPTAYRQFMDQHWESWLSQVVLIAVLGLGFLGYKFDYLHESMIGLVLVGGLIAIAIYSTAGPAYDMIESSRGRTLFAILTLVWAASVGYPAMRKAVPRKVLAETALTEQNKSLKLPIGEGANGPYDITVSGSMKPEAGSERKVDYTVVVTGDDGKAQELSGEFETRVNQMRTRRGSTHWTQQNNQIEHRLAYGTRGKELLIATEQVDEILQSGLHVAVHPQSLDPQWFLLAGILVVLGMIFVETRIGDSKNKTHLIMASASTLIFSWYFAKTATANRLVPPALDSLFLALLTGGIGGTLIGAVARRVSGRDRLKPRSNEELAEDNNKDA